MNEAEIRLKRSVYELFRVVRMNAHMKKAQAELTWLLDGSDVSLEMFEGRPGSEKLEDAKEFFETLLVKVKESYGTRSVAAAYNRFKAAIDDKAYRESLGLTDELTNEDKSTLFKKAFDMVVPAAEKWDFEDDFFSYFIETVKELIMPTGEMDTEQEESCPYCDGTPQKISKGEFFGPRSAEGEGYVWGCECGAYAVMSDDGEVHGKLGDTLLHQKRNLLKGAICELCILAGMTSYESYRWFSIITGQRLNSAADVEYLDLDACNIALRMFICIKQKIQNTEYNYPKDRGELFLFLTDGGRLMVCNAFGFQYGNLIIPSEIGPEGIRIFGKEGKRNISFSDTLQYEFKGDQFFIVHPSGKKEKFRMMPTEIRNLIMSLREEDLLALKGV